MTERGKEVAETLKDVHEDIKTVVPIATEIIQEIKKAVAFVVRCFKCKNEPGTPILLKHDSIEIKQVRNSVQVGGVCATCGKKVRGFISVKAAEEKGFKYTPTHSYTPLAKKRKEVEEGKEEPPAKVAATTLLVGEPAIAVDENKQ
jgi:hypothetical protein